jgi:hypothetical protein
MGQRPCPFLFSQRRLLIPELYSTTFQWHFNHRTYKSKHRWHSIDVHCHDGVMKISCTILTETQPVHSKWILARHCQSDKPWHIVEYCWRSGDAHFQMGAVTVLHTFLLVKAANTPFIPVCNSSQLRLRKMQNQKLLTLLWCSFSWWGIDSTDIAFASNGW